MLFQSHNSRLYSVRIGRGAQQPLRELSPDFLSLTIDSSLVFGGHWWGSTKRMRKGVSVNRVNALDLGRPELVAYAAALAPAMLRIGGTEADRVKYEVGKTNFCLTCGIPGKIPHEIVMGKKLWKRINRFALQAGLKVLFTLSAGPADRDASGAWDPANAIPLLDYSARKGFPVSAWELGNEVNGFPFFYGWKNRVSAVQYARDFERFARVVKRFDPSARVIGPASAIWPKIGEPNPIIKMLCASPAARYLEAVSWHYYPQQSSYGPVATRRAGKRRMLNPRILDGVKRWNRNIEASRKNAEQVSGSVENWITETASALYGGEPGLSDSFFSSLWWLDELGLLAREGAHKVFRQSLVGARYGLLDQLSLAPRPDYYASFLWKKIMGPYVLPLEGLQGPDQKLRCYRHTPAAGFRKQYSDAFLFINLNAKESAEVDISAFPAAKGGAGGRFLRRGCRFLLQGAGDPGSGKMLLNGVPVEDDMVFKWDSGGLFEKYRVAPEKNLSSFLMLPPLSVLFFLGDFDLLYN